MQPQSPTQIRVISFCCDWKDSLLLLPSRFHVDFQIWAQDEAAHQLFELAESSCGGRI